MKKILSVIILLVLTATVVQAASINGDFNGNPIVKVKANGKELTVENTPAVIYNGNTLVPIYMFRQLGASVTWDAKSYSIDVSLPSVVDASKLARETKKYGVSFVSYTSDGEGFDRITYYYDGGLDKLFSDNAGWTGILVNGASTDAYLIEIMADNEDFFTVPIQAVKDFFDKKITSEELTAQYKINEF